MRKIHCRGGSIFDDSFYKGSIDVNTFLRRPQGWPAEKLIILLALWKIWTLLFIWSQTELVISLLRKVMILPCVRCDHLSWSGTILLLLKVMNLGLSKLSRNASLLQLAWFCMSLEVWFQPLHPSPLPPPPLSIRPQLPKLQCLQKYADTLIRYTDDDDFLIQGVIHCTEENVYTKSQVDTTMI